MSSKCRIGHLQRCLVMLMYEGDGGDGGGDVKMSWVRMEVKSTGAWEVLTFTSQKRGSLSE